MTEQGGSSTRIHYGVRPGNLVGGDGVADYYEDKAAAAQAATMPGCELVQAEVSYSPWTVIPNPLAEGGTE
jgi:hypothetical protein